MNRVTAATSPDSFLGSWIAQSIFVEYSNKHLASRLRCFFIELNPSRSKCSCEGVPMTSFMVNISFVNSPDNAVRRKTVFIVDSYEEAFDAAHRHCNCGAGEFNVFRKLDSDHYISYFQSKNRNPLDAVLLSRKLTSQLEMVAYEAQLFPEFKNKRRVPVCILSEFLRQRNKI